MYERPQFKPHFSIYIIDEEKAVFLLSEQGYYLLQGKLYCHLAPFLDGQHSVDEIIDNLAGQASIAEIYYALGIMEKRGYLTEAEDSISREQLGFWSALGMDPKMAVDKLKNSRISVLSLGTDQTTSLESVLKDLHIEIAADADLSIVLVDDYLHPGLAELNQSFLREKRSWMLVKAGGTVPWLGPIFIPGVTGCWECLAQRQRINRDVEEYIRRRKGLPSPVSAFPASLPASRQLVWGLLAAEVAKHLLTGHSQFSGAQVISIDTLTMKIETHTLLKRPQCPVCGVPDTINTALKAPALQPAPKLFTADGGHRNVLPEQTLQKYGHHVSSITGAVKYLKNAMEDDPFLKVYWSGQNNAVSYENLAFLRRGLRSQSAGKGMTEIQARASAICEALERHSGVFRGDEVRIRATFQELGEKAIHPNRIMNFSETQYRDREWQNSDKDRYNSVPERFDENQEMDWTPVWSLTQEEFRYLPTSFCYYHHPESKTVYPCSNGNASGNILEEAILQGFFELVERDSVAIWWYNRLNMPGVDLDSFNEPYINELRDYYRAQNREIWALDLTSDLGIPAFAALVRRTNSQEEHIMTGFGAHFEARVALTRALTELNQMMPFAWSIEKTKDEKTEIDDDTVVTWLRQATVANQPYLLPHPDIPRRKADEYKDLSSDDFLKDIETCRRIVEGKGMEMLFLDQTRADIGMPVVKVFVPGLRHFWKRLAPGRLYDVPVQMGWLPAPKKESEMNPIGVFL